MDVSTVRSRLEPGGRRIRVAIDAMGGDHAPQEVVEGSLAWALENPGTDIILVGDTKRISAVLAGRSASGDFLGVAHPAGGFPWANRREA